ncbi:MAG: glycosyltransferase family 2 protein [Granulosicoccus sp.]
MATVTVYHPTPLSLPAVAPVTRTFYDARSHLPGRPALTEADYEGFERHAVFHDIYLATDGLRAIGPPLVNLAKEVLPLDVRIIDEYGQPGEQLTHRMTKRDRVAFHHFALPAQQRSAPALSVRIRLANGNETTFDVRRQQPKPVFLQFVTMQKNSPIVWIMDWLTYLAELGVQRVILYDNGSDNFIELSQSLAAAPADLDIILVDWPFAYGPVRSFYNQFSQASQNNHVHQCFANASWVGHFDLDEFLLCADGQSLRKRLEQLPGRVGCLRIDSYWMPNLQGAGLDSERLPTIRDFPYREKKPRGAAFKYLVRQSALKEAKTHNGLLKFGYFRLRPKPEKLVFMHYKALTTGWKTYWNRQVREPVDPDLHVQDRRVFVELERIAERRSDVNKLPAKSAVTVTKKHINRV